MSDIFTLKTVALTPELGMAIKNFRIENKVTAKSITEEFKRASSYVSKLENGDIKKIESDFLIKLCNYITNSENGLSIFLSKLVQNFTEYTNETKFIIMNIDDLLLEHPVPTNFVSDINEYLSSHNITSAQLLNMINANEDIAERNDYKEYPENIWYNNTSDIDNASIKFVIPPEYITNLLDGKLTNIHRVIAEGILYSLYKLGKEENPHTLACEKLDLYQLIPTRRKVYRVNTNKLDEILSDLEPDAAKAMEDVTTSLKLITTLTKNYGAKRIKQISKNMHEDLGFSFAYMSVDIVELEKKDKEKKQQFLDELKLLVEKYSQDDTGIDMYE